MKNVHIKACLVIALSIFIYGHNSYVQASESPTYSIVDTNQQKHFDNKTKINAPQKGEAFYGQDAQFIKNTPSYTDNKDGTVTDNVTGLIWQKSYQVLSYSEAIQALKKFNEQSNEKDWRLPNIKEAYSLIDFSGKDVSGADMENLPIGDLVPFINTEFFDFDYGSNGTRIIDTQVLSSTVYNGVTLGNNKTVFGVNFADGRIKGYPMGKTAGGADKKYTVRFVRGNENYGINSFVDTTNNTITDEATGLMWAKNDSQKAMSWQEALAWVEEKNNEKYLGYSDWRLPDAKELHSIVDYTKSPQALGEPAIDKAFNISTITKEDGKTGHPFFWTSTTHENMVNGSAAIYFAFGEAMGYWPENPRKKQSKKVAMDVHGAGAQRSDPKIGNPKKYPQGKGPQGDAIRIYNYARLVRDAN